MAVRYSSNHVLGPGRHRSKNTLGLVLAWVVLSTAGSSHLSNSMPVSRSIGEGIFLTNGHQHIVGFNKHIGLAGGYQLAFAFVVV